MMRKLKRLLYPDWRRMVLFAILVAITIGGRIQAWAFTDLPPKPALYDLLRPFPIWPLWMLLLLPLALLALPLGLFGLDVMGGPYGVFIVANLAYFYLLSCLIVAAFNWIRARWRPQRKAAK